MLCHGQSKEMVGRAVPTAAVLNPRTGAGGRIPAHQPADAHAERHGRAPSSPRSKLLPLDLVLRHQSLVLLLRR
nr:unnamed protein product [Digitaria exilis]